jgi:hypothetical protein
VVSPYDAALQEAPEAFDIVGMDVTAHIFAMRVIHELMRQSHVLVIVLFIGDYERDLVADDVAHEAAQGARILIAYHLANDIAFASYRADDANLVVADTFAKRLRALGRTNLCALAIPVAIGILAADVGFVSLYNASKREGIATHRSAPAIAHIPASAPVGAGILTEYETMDLQRANSLFRSQHEIANLEPKPQRYFGIHENGSADDAETIAIALVASQDLAGLVIDSLRAALTNPMVGTCLEHINPILCITSGTANTIRPTLRS